MIFAAGMLFYGCQEEYLQVTEPDNSATFSSGDTIAGLILKVTMKDGSFDDIIDNCSGISINFPYEVRIRNEKITINSQEDIEHIKQAYAQFKNAIKIQFPVTVTFSDYSETVLKNRGELQKIQNQYQKDQDGASIKCIDFVYPIDINLYDIQYQKPEFFSVETDKKLHSLLKNRNDILFEIGYPLFVELFDGTVLKVENNLELQTEITDALGICDNETEFNEEDSSHDK